MRHELRYQAGLSGFGAVDTSPHWYCTCGQWKKYRDHQGRPFEATAKRQHRKHIAETTEAGEGESNG